MKRYLQIPLLSAATFAMSAIALTVLASSSFAAERLRVKVINKQSNSTNYTYTVPGTVNSQTNAMETCTDGLGGATCSGNRNTTAVVTAPRSGSFSVPGATLTLELPDGRLAVANYVSK
jgi:hypothetical protein